MSERQIQVWLQNKRQRSKARMQREAATAIWEPNQLIHEPFNLALAPQPVSAEACVRDDLSMQIFVDSHAPFKILWANKDWLSFCGFTQSDLKGQTMNIIQGPETDEAAAQELADAGRERRCGDAVLVNYTKNFIPFRHTVHVEPLINSYGQVRMYKASSKDVEVLDEENDSFHSNSTEALGEPLYFP